MLLRSAFYRFLFITCLFAIGTAVYTLNSVGFSVVAFFPAWLETVRGDSFLLLLYGFSVFIYAGTTLLEGARIGTGPSMYAAHKVPPIGISGLFLQGGLDADGNAMGLPPPPVDNMDTNPHRWDS